MSARMIEKSLVLIDAVGTVGVFLEYCLNGHKVVSDNIGANLIRVFFIVHWLAVTHLSKLAK